MAHGVEGLRIVERDELVEMEPNISDEAVAALYAPTGGIVCPFGLTFALAENAARAGELEDGVAHVALGGVVQQEVIAPAGDDGHLVVGHHVVELVGVQPGGVDQPGSWTSPMSRTAPWWS